MICTEITESARSLQSELTCPICLYMLTNSMGTLKTVCSSWFALISHVEHEHEHMHLRVPIKPRLDARLFVDFYFSPIPSCFCFEDQNKTIFCAKQVRTRKNTKINKQSDVLMFEIRLIFLLDFPDLALICKSKQKQFSDCVV